MAVSNAMTIHWMSGMFRIKSTSLSFAALERSSGGGRLDTPQTIGSGKTLINYRC